DARAGRIGVQLFFALSGFLITSLLVEEWDRFHTISLRRFYLRRSLRLLPALVAMMVGVTFYHWAAESRAAATATAGEALIALFYSSNWTLALGQGRPYVFGHTWSLSIEEQFYLLWPLFLLWLLRIVRSRCSLRNLVILAAF